MLTSIPSRLVTATVIVTTLSFTLTGVWGGEESPTFRRTFGDEELEIFCNNRHVGIEGAGKSAKGYLHPFYCSRYIECLKVKGIDGIDVIKAQEKICPRCASESKDDESGGGKGKLSRRQRPKNKLCKFGHLHFNEELQTCQPQKRKCIQSELPKNNVWGRRDLVTVCEDIAVGTTQSFPNPYHCGKYVTCHRDMDYFRDLWITVEVCPSCDTSTPGCPDGYMHYHLPINGTDGLCRYTTSIPAESKCNPATRKVRTKGLVLRIVPHGPAAPAALDAAIDNDNSTTPATPTDIVDNIPKENSNAAANAFCAEKEQRKKRYPVDGKCNKYIYCFVDLFDRDGDMRPLDKVHHFEFTCDTCTDVHATSDNCNATTNGQNNFLAFDFEQQTCLIPTNGTCLHDGSFKVNEEEIVLEKNEDSKLPSWKTPIMTQDDVVDFCKEKGTTGNFPHPKDTTCSRYVECWVKMNVYKEKSCPRCHPNLISSKSLCPHGHLYFNPETGSCKAGQNLSSCTPEDSSAGTVPPNQPDPVDIWSTTPNPEQTIEEITDEESQSHADLMTPTECDPKNYVQRGYCKTYFTCDRKIRMEKVQECSGRLYWNPDVNTIHGGVCDFLRNIDNFTLFQYKKDPGCALHLAYFRVMETECSGTYYYHHPTRTLGKEVKLTCPEDLVWSKDVKTCVKCHQIMKADGVSPCCSLPDGDGEDDVESR